MSQVPGAPDFEAACASSVKPSGFDELDDSMLTVKQELSKRKRTAGKKVHELDSLNHYLELVLSSVASGVISGYGGRITTVNPAARRMCAGLDMALKVRLRAYFRSPSGSNPSRVKGPLRSLRRLPDPEQGERILEVVTSAIIDGEGQVVGAVEVLDDGTDVRRLQEAVERGERLKSLGEMAAGVARNQSSQWYRRLCLLLARDAGLSRSARHAQAIMSGVRDLNRTVNGLLQFTQQRQPDMRQIAVAQVMEDVYELVQAELGVSEQQVRNACCQISCDIAPEWREQPFSSIRPGFNVILNGFKTPFKLVKTSLRHVFT